MNTLKNGFQTRDSRLTRIPQFDERSKSFPIRTIVTNQTPRSYTWSCDTYLDQGSEGACVGFSLAHELIAKPSVVNGITEKFAKENIYWEAQKIDDWAGGSYPGASTHYEGTSVLAGVKVVQKLGYIKEYRWAFGLDDLILAVGRKGPAVLGVNWYEGMFDTHSCGYIHATGELMGGHAILCKGVNLKEKYFILHNSWGNSWGTGGCAKISFDDMEFLLEDNGEAVIPVIRNTSMISFVSEVIKNLVSF